MLVLRYYFYSAFLIVVLVFHIDYIFVHCGHPARTPPVSPELDVFAFLGGDGVDPLLFLAVVLLDVTVPFEELKKSAGTRSLTKPKTTLKLAVRS